MSIVFAVGVAVGVDGEEQPDNIREYQLQEIKVRRLHSGLVVAQR
jgi:hypothetical protein